MEKRAMSDLSRCKLHECVGCGHLYQVMVTACDCMNNPENIYREWTAIPSGEFNKLMSAPGGEAEPVQATIRRVQRNLQSGLYCAQQLGGRKIMNIEFEWTPLAEEGPGTAVFKYNILERQQTFMSYRDALYIALVLSDFVQLAKHKGKTEERISILHYLENKE